MALIGVNGGLIGTHRSAAFNDASGLWTANEQVLLKRAGLWLTDPYLANTILLLHMDGTNGSTTFTDSSGKSQVATANGNAQISTTQSKFGGSSGAFDGTGDWVAYASNNEFAFGTGDFTVELFIYFNVVNSSRAIYETPGVAAAGARSTGFVWYMTAANKLQVFSVSSDRGASVTTLTSATWYHIALVRSAGVFSYFIDGIKDATTFTLATNYTDTTPLLGRFCDSTSNMFNGYIDEVRVTKGIARYTANFTPPSGPFLDVGTGGEPYFATTSLLLHMDGTNGSTTFPDTSPNVLSVTASGNAQVSTAQSKFGGASALFDGTGDYLSTANTSLLEFDGNDFTVEMWINTTQNRQYATLITRGNATFTGGAWTLLINNTSSTAGDVAVYCAAFSGASTLLATTGANVRDGAWHHIAWVRSGTDHYIFVDGIQRASRTGTSFTIPTLTATTTIGYDANFTPRDFNGYIDDLRITKGVARYTATFTPPTAAFPDA